MEQGLSRDLYDTSRAGHFDYDYAHEHAGTFPVESQQRKCVVPSCESLVQVTVEHMEQGLSRDSYETSPAGYFDYDYTHDGTFLLDTQQRKCLVIQRFRN